MKFSTVAIAMLLGRLTGIFAMDISNQFTFLVDVNTTFSIRHFNDERVQAFRLIYRDADVAGTYAFRSDGRLTSFRFTTEGEVPADERFRVNYNSQTGDIVGFIPTEIGMPTPQDLPELFVCNDCITVKDNVCGFIGNFCMQHFTNLISRRVLSTYLCDIVYKAVCDNLSAQDVCRSETCILPEKI